MTRVALTLGVSLALALAGGCEGDDEPSAPQGGGGSGATSSGTGASAAGGTAGSDPCGGITCACPSYVGDEQAGSFCVGDELYDCAVACFECGCSCVGVFTTECDPGGCIDQQDRNAHCSGAGGAGGQGGS